MTKVDEILHAAVKLSEPERTEIAMRLLDSLEPPDPLGPIDDDAWVAEIEKRADEAASGTAPSRSWEDVRRDIEGKPRP